MEKVGLITIIGNNNYGNRLQNYAIQKFLSKINIKSVTLKNNHITNKHNKLFLRKIKLLFSTNIYNYSKDNDRKNNFKNFNKNINFSKKMVFPNSTLKSYHYFIIGSDQVWNPYLCRLRDVDALSFASPNKRIAFAASFGVDTIPTEYKKIIKNEISKFKAISVREYSGKKIIEDLTGRKDVEVLIDPTMLLTNNEWDKVSKKPKNFKNEKYILNYFLGQLSEQRKKEIEKIAKENNCKIINILDKSDPFYASGPSEFLYLEKHAFLICTDSFHSSVFAILYNRPFIVFERIDNAKDMSSRINTLLSKFKLEDRRYNGKITKNLLKHDYTETYKMLEEERKKSIKFLENALKNR